MKKILILAYDFPPNGSIGGQRPYSWYKYFREFDINPTVITRHWDRPILEAIDCERASLSQTTHKEDTKYGTIIRIPHLPNLRDKLMLAVGIDKWITVRKGLSLFYHLAQYQFWFADNKAGIYNEAKALLKTEKFDGIIATGEPFILHRYAALLAKEYSLPWIADFRDGWSTNSNTNHNSYFKKLNQTFFRRKELATSNKASLLTTAAPIYKKRLAVLHHKKQIEVIYNGFFADEYENLETADSNKKQFSISYAGLLYGFQPIEHFLEAFESFINETGAKDCIINFYGTGFYPEQAKRILSACPKINSYIKIHPRIPKKELLPILKQQNALLLLANPVEERLAAKLLDYLPLSPPILMTKNDEGIMSSIIKETNAGSICNSKQEIVDQLKSWYNLYKEGKDIQFEKKSSHKYSRKQQAQKMANLLLNIIEK